MADVRAVFNLNRADVEQAVTGPDSLPRQRMAALGRRIVANAQQRAPVNTGNLRRGIGMDLAASGLTLTMGIFSKAKYTSFVHDGTRPHLIFPRSARVLRFQTGGRTVFAAYVKHPGTAPRPFIRQAIEDEIGKL
ncbi:HK97 gp10 family phage protein [Rhodococcus koreensis]